MRLGIHLFRVKLECTALLLGAGHRCRSVIE